ncbi:MAG: emrD [Gammaproteobacteria bacterium]|nr:emrD [Gammaproteobacteria bacterium]
MTTSDTKPAYGSYFITLVILIAAASQLAADMYLPSLPAIAQALHSSSTAMGLTVTIFLLGQAIFQWVYGPASERYGRKRLILSGMLITGIGTLVCLWSDNITLFSIGRFLQGAGSAALMCLALATMRDAFANEKLGKVMATLNMTFSIVFAIAPVAGGYLQKVWSWQASFVLIAVYILVLFIIASMTLPETHAPERRDINGTKIAVILDNSKTLLRSGAFMGYSIMVGVCYAALVAYAALTPFLFQNVMGLTPVAYGWLAIVNAIALSAGSATVAVLIEKLGIPKIIKAGLVIMLLGALCMLATGLLQWINIAAIMAPMFIALYGATFILNAAGSAAMSPFGHIAGTAGAMCMSLQMLAAFIAGSIAAHFHSTNQIPLAMTIIILALITGAINTFVVPRKA